MKKLLSMVLATLMLLSAMVTGVGTVSAADTAVVNGKTVEVGSEVQFEVGVQVPEAIENFQGYLTYSKDGLEYVSYSHTNFANGLWSANGKTEPGFVYYSATDGEEGYDVTSYKALATFKFKVTKAGTWNIKNDFEVLTGLNATGASGTPYVKDSKVVKSFVQDTKLICTEVTPSTDATVNGKKVAVGSQVQFEVDLSLPEAIENFQAFITYDKDGLKYESYKKGFSNGLWSANGTTDPGYVYYSATDGEEGYDVTTKKPIATFTFTVTKAGTWNISNTFEVVTGLDATGSNGHPYVKDSKVVDSRFKSEEKLIAEELPAGKTTVNGVEYAVGSEVTYVVNAAFDKPIATIQGRMLYSSEGLEPTATKGTFGEKITASKVSNTKDTKTLPGQQIVSYNALAAEEEPYDLKSESKIISVTFRITKEGTWTISNSFIRVDAADDTVYVLNGEKKRDFTEKDVVNGTPVTPTTEPTTKPTTAPTTKPTTAPTPTKTTFNGVEVQVGDKIQVDYYFQADKQIGAFEGQYNWGNKTTGDKTGIEIVSASCTAGAGTMGQKNLKFTDFRGPYDYTTKKVLASVVFQVTQAGEYFATADMIELMAQDGTDYAVDGKVLRPFTWEMKQTNNSATTAPTPATYKIAKVLNQSTCSNAATSIVDGQTYSATFTPKTGYEITAVTVKNGSATETATKNSDGTYSVSFKAKGVISITVTTKAKETTPATYTITKTLNQSTSSNAATTITAGATYTSKFTAKSGYEITAVTVKNGTDNVTATKNSDGSYSVSFTAKGNITITVTTKAKETTPSSSVPSTPTTATPVYEIIKNLTNVNSSNNAATVKKGGSYQTVLTPATGFEIVTVLVSNGDDTVNPTKNSDGSYSINVIAKGDILITAIAAQKETTAPSTTKGTDPVVKNWNVTTVLTNATISNTAKTVKDGETFTAVVTPSAGYSIPQGNITVLVGGTPAVPVKTGDMYTISVKATGDIMIVAQAVKIEGSTTAPTTKPTDSTLETEPATQKGDVIEISKMTLNHASLTMKEGDTVNLMAAIWPGYTTEKTITWSVTNSRVGVCSQTKNTVTGLRDDDGKLYCTETATFKAVDDGMTIVKAVSNTGLVVKCVINVKPVAETLSVNKPSVTLNTGKTFQAKATVGPTTLDSKYRTVQWTSSNKKVATVNSAGVIRGVGKGTATITATSKDNTSLKKTIRVTVKQLVTKISFSKSSVSLAKKGATASVKVTASPSNANNKKMTIKSTNKKIATVNKSSINSGASVKITAKKKGSAYVQATATDGSKKTAKIKVTVKK